MEGLTPKQGQPDFWQEELLALMDDVMGNFQQHALNNRNTTSSPF